MIVDISIAYLVMHRPKGKRKLGFKKGEVNIPSSFTQESSDINKLFYK